MAQPETQYVFNGIGFDEARDRYNEHRTGVPALGQMQQLLFAAPVKGGREFNPFLSAVQAWNTGEFGAHLRLKHGGTEKTQTDELLVGLRVGATNVFRGQLQFKGLVAGSVLVEDGGALPDLVDDGQGNLNEATTGTKRGEIDYINGTIDFDYGAAITLPVTITYNHGDDEDFATGTLTATKTSSGEGSAGDSELIQAQLAGIDVGRINPGSVSVSDGGGLTFVDDGKGNIVQTNTGDNVVGSVDYATGLIDINDASADLTGTITTTFTMNPFAAVLSPGAGKKLMDLFSQLPELTNTAWGQGTAQDNRVGLHGEATDADGQTNLVTRWYHFSEEPFRVEDPFSGFPAGGHDNDPRLLVNRR